MKRRILIPAAIAAGTLALQKPSVSQSPLAVTESPIQWRMATSWTKSIDITFDGVKLLCQRVREMTNGQFIITPYEAGELTSALKVMDAVQAGTVECGHTASHYYLDKHPAFAFAATIPFGLTQYQQQSWFYYGGGLEVLKPLFDNFGVVAFPAGSPGVQMGGWFKREINSVEDFQGLKFRIPGFGGRVMARLGADVQLLGGDRVYEALATGKIDGAEWQNPYDDEKLGLHKAATYYYYPGWWEPGLSYFAVVNQTQWESLPKQYQQIFRAAAAETNMTVLARYDAANGEALERLIAGGTQLRAYSNEILQAAYQATMEVLNEQASKDATFKVIYQQWNAFRKSIYQWNQINELSFETFALQMS